MSLPETKEALEQAGYVFSNEARCRGPECGELIEWWITPNNKKMPMSVRDVRKDPDNAVSPVTAWVRVPHWQVCSNAKDFKR